MGTRKIVICFNTILLRAKLYSVKPRFSLVIHLLLKVTYKSCCTLFISANIGLWNFTITKVNIFGPVYIHNIVHYSHDAYDVRVCLFGVYLKAKVIAEDTTAIVNKPRQRVKNNYYEKQKLINTSPINNLMINEAVPHQEGIADRETDDRQFPNNTYLTINPQFPEIYIEQLSEDKTIITSHYAERYKQIRRCRKGGILLAFINHENTIDSKSNNSPSFTNGVSREVVTVQYVFQFWSNNYLMGMSFFKVSH